MPNILKCLLPVLAIAINHGALAQNNETQASPDPLAKGIQDNSFIIEEAYNQDQGVVQTLMTFRGQARNRFFALTQEFPIGGWDHQLSYSVPFSLLRNQGVTSRGLGDVFLNYRYQALYETAITPAFAPRLSLILPTGSASAGAGNGSWGFQVGMPFSKIVTDRITLHGNLGVTTYADVQGRSPKTYSAGGSIVYAVTRNLNFLMETVGERTESVNSERKIERQSQLTVSPGVRYAVNFTDFQVVFGVGAPVVMQHKTRPSYGALVYLSLEGKAFR